MTLLASVLLAFLTATADRNGVTIYGDPALNCLVNRQLGAAIGFTPWSVIAPYTTPRVGAEVLVQCWLPGTSGFHQVTTTVEGYAVFVPMVTSIVTKYDNRDVDRDVNRDEVRGE